MGDIIAISGLLSGCALGLRGGYFFYINRNEAKRIFGLEVSGKIVIALLLFFAFLLLLFFGLTYLNIILGLVAVDKSGNFYALLTGSIPHLSTAFLEEFFFRLLLFCSFLEFVKSRTLIVAIVSVLFCLFHLPENILSFFSYFLGGVMYGYAYLKFQNILIPIIIHFSWNFIQGTVFGYPVTGTASESFLELSIIPHQFFNGGDQGPEGNISGIFIRILIVLTIYLYPFSSKNGKFLKLSNS